MTRLTLVAASISAVAALLATQPAAAVEIARHNPTAVSADGAQAAVADFLDAFNRMDMARFEAAWAEDATAFLPGAPFPTRHIAGRDEIVPWFGRLFGVVRERGREALNLNPQDLEVRTRGDMAVATFHLNSTGDVGRRTLVLHRGADGWRIVHMHASTADEPTPPTPTPPA